MEQTFFTSFIYIHTLRYASSKGSSKYVHLHRSASEPSLLGNAIDSDYYMTIFISYPINGYIDPRHPYLPKGLFGLRVDIGYDIEIAIS